MASSRVGTKGGEEDNYNSSYYVGMNMKISRWLENKIDLITMHLCYLCR